MPFAFTALTLSILAAPPVTLWDNYQRFCEQPAEYRGFSFGGSPEEMEDMRALGCNLAGANKMWMPVRDPEAPFGVAAPYRPERHREIRQRFQAPEGLTNLRLQLPTMHSTGSVTISLFRLNGERRKVAEKRFKDVPDLFWAELPMEPQDPGAYEVALTDPSGRVGVWVMPAGEDPRGALLLDGAEAPGQRLEFVYATPGGEEAGLAGHEEHSPLWLGEPRFPDMTASYGMDAMIWVGNWNNGAFPYYPDWFYELHPDITMQDASGAPIRAGMFGVEKGWPSIDHPAIVSGTSRHITNFVRNTRDSEALAYWALGGEALYPGYLTPLDGWPDYAPLAQRHFRAWLRQFRYDSLEHLNKAWSASYPDWEDVSAPIDKRNIEPYRDWIDYRFMAMAERMSWHYAAVRAADPLRPATEGSPGRPVFTSNHGDLFHGSAFVDLGADLSLFADASDGFEMGQIMEAADPHCYNLMWTAATAGLGKIGAATRLAYKWPDADARGGSTSYTPAAARRYAIEALGSGWWHAGFIQWSGSLPDGEWGVEGTPAEREFGAIFSDFDGLDPVLKNAWPVFPQVAFYPSYEQWTYYGWNSAWTRFHVWAVRRQISHALLWERQLLAGEAEPYKAIVSIDNLSIRPGVAEALEAYLDRPGHHLICVGRQHAGIEALESRKNVLRVESVEHVGAALREAGVRPFCGLQTSQTIDWRETHTPGSPSRGLPYDLAPRQTAGRVFHAPADKITRVEFHVPTFMGKPQGFEAVFRLREEGPDGAVLAEGALPATEIADNLWIGVPVDVQVERGARLYAEMTVSEDIAPLRFGVWADDKRTSADSPSFIDSRKQDFDIMMRVETLYEVNAAEAVEAFVLADGARYVAPLYNRGEESVIVRPRLDSSLTDGAGGYQWFDALTGDSLGAAPEITMAAHDYRILEAKAVEGPAPTAAPEVNLSRVATVFTEDGSLNVVMDAESGGAPLRSAVVVVRLVPLPGVYMRLEETAPGRYEGVLPSQQLVRYDYAGGAYVPYEGPLELIVNLWKGRDRANKAWVLRAGDASADDALDKGGG